MLGGDGAYLDAVIKETLRLRPPVPVVVRRLLEPMELGGHELPAGTTVAPCIHLIHLSEDTYEEPRRFRPERFLERPPGTYTWIPFGGGTRRCLAASYAEMEMKRVLRTVLADGRPAAGRRPLRADEEKRDLLQPRPERAGHRRTEGGRHGRLADPGARIGQRVPMGENSTGGEADLLIVGAGAKAAAIAAKVHVINTLGLGQISVTVVEKTEPAASWLGRNGMTSGEEPLAIPPIKDVGFPYQSRRQFGEAGDDDRRRAPALHLAALRDRARRVRALGQLRDALGAPPRLRHLPGLGPLARHRGGQHLQRPRHRGLAHPRGGLEHRGRRTGAAE